MGVPPIPDGLRLVFFTGEEREMIFPVLLPAAAFSWFDCLPNRPYSFHRDGCDDCDDVFGGGILSSHRRVSSHGRVSATYQWAVHPSEYSSLDPTGLYKKTWECEKFSLNSASVSAILSVYVLDGCPPSAPTDGFRAVVSFAFDIASPFCSIVCALRKSVFFTLFLRYKKSSGDEALNDGTP